jgi:hypothetical protein
MQNRPSGRNLKIGVSKDVCGDAVSACYHDLKTAAHTAQIPRSANLWGLEERVVLNLNIKWLVTSALTLELRLAVGKSAVTIE